MCGLQGCMAITVPPSYFGVSQVSHSVYSKTKRWEVGQLLTYSTNSPRKEFRPNAEQEALLSQVIHFIEQKANIKFGRVTKWEDATIRIEFDPRSGNWSYVGTDAIFAERSKPTMNLGDKEYGIYGHEFYHALGFFHEHQNPEQGIEWNKDWNYKYYAKAPNYWNKAMVDHNIHRRLAENTYMGTEYDPKSWMHYPIKKESNKQGYEVGWNLQPSEKDIIGLQMAYPFPAKEIDKEVKDFFQKLFVSYNDWNSIREPKLVEIANHFGIDAKVIDWKRNTIAKMQNLFN